MKASIALGCCLLSAAWALPMTAHGATDAVGDDVRTLGTPRTFSPVPTVADWQTRAKEIREQVLVSCGLWPLPRKTPLHAQVFGRIEREDYTVDREALLRWLHRL